MPTIPGDGGNLDKLKNEKRGHFYFVKKRTFLFGVDRSNWVLSRPKGRIFEGKKGH